MKTLPKAGTLLLITAAVTASFEWDSAVVLGLFLIAVITLLLGLTLESREQDDQYLLAVEAYRRPCDALMNAAFIHSISAHLGRGLWAILLLIGLGFLAVLADSPLLVIGVLVLLLARFMFEALRSRYRGRPGWRTFAEANTGLVHDGGDLLNRWCPEKIMGSYRERAIQLSTVTRTTSNRPAHVAVTAELHSASETFCWETPQLADAMSLQAGPLSRNTDLGRRLAAVSPIRLTVSDTQLSLYTPRLPKTAIELRFFCELICDLSHSIENQKNQELRAKS